MTRNRLLRWLVEPERPGLGIDVRSDAIAIARLSEKRAAPEIDLCSFTAIPEGLVRFHMTEPNLLDERGFEQLLSSALTRAGLNGGKRAALTLPDPLCRVAVMELPDAPRSSAELVEVLKFRMKKSLPFDVDHARVAFERLPGAPPTFLTGVMHEQVISQYEDVLGRLGFQVGLVLPASVSLLSLLRPVALRELGPESDYFFVNAERDYFSASLVRSGDVPVLVRTLGLRAGGNGPKLYGEEDLLQEIIPTAIYYREKLEGQSLERVYYRSLRPDLVHLRELLEEQFETVTEPFNLQKAVSVSQEVALDAAAADSIGAAAGAAAGKAA